MKWHLPKGLPPIIIFLGVVTLIFGVIVWDFERRDKQWDPTKDQARELKNVLVGYSVNRRFLVRFYPIDTNELANNYAHKIQDIFHDANWPTKIHNPNHVPPGATKGMSVVTCETPSNLNLQQADELKNIFEMAKIKRNDKVTHEGDLDERKCSSVGLVFGPPSSAFKR